LKAVILAGGLGTRLGEEADRIPKPLVQIGGKPIIWHIMKNYSEHCIKEFIICLGFKGYEIKEYFFNYLLHSSDVTLNLGKNQQVEFHNNSVDQWKVTLIDTGIDVMTGGRLKRIQEFLDPTEPFFLTYGDGVGDIDVNRLLRFHKDHQGLATVTAVRSPGRFGHLSLDGNFVTEFKEKPIVEDSWINGGFFVLSPLVLNYIDGDDTYWEREPLAKLAEENQLHAYRHEGFWQAMDTPRDRQELQSLWDSSSAPWKTW